MCLKAEQRRGQRSEKPKAAMHAAVARGVRRAGHAGAEAEGKGEVAAPTSSLEKARACLPEFHGRKPAI